MEWREASTNDAGWMEGDMGRRRNGWLWNGSFGGRRHGLIFGRQRDDKSPSQDRALCLWAPSVAAKKLSGVLR